MKNIQKIIQKLNNKNLLYVFILLNPILDLLTSLGINEKILYIGSVGFLFRGLFLLFVVADIFFAKSLKKKNYIFLLSLIMAFYILFNINRFFVDSNFNLILELKAFIKAFYFPILFIGIMNYFDYQKNKNDLPKLFKIISLTTIVYLILIIIPSMLGIGYKSYASAKQGVIGFFNSPNEIGTILAILSPIILNFIKMIKNKFIGVVVSILFIYGCLIIGTKTPLLGIIIAIIIDILMIIVSFVKNKEIEKIKLIIYPIYWSVVVLVILLFASPLFNNLGWQSKLFDNNNPPSIEIPNNTTGNKEETSKPSDSEDKTEKPSQGNSSKPSDSEDKTEKPSQGNSSKPSDSEDKTEKPSQGNSSKPSDSEDKTEKPSQEKETNNKKINLMIKKVKNLIFSSRDIYIDKGYKTFNDSLATEKIFGLGNATLKVENKNTVEIDLFDILFNYGWLGFIIYFGILLIAIMIMIKNLIFNFKQKFNNLYFNGAFVGGIIGVLIAFTAGHTMLAPAVSIYLSILLAVGCSDNVDKNLKNSKLLNISDFVWKKKIYLILIFILLCAFVVIYDISSNFNNMFKLTEQGIKFNSDNLSDDFGLVDSYEKEEFNVKDKTYIYQNFDKSILLQYTRRYFENGSMGYSISKYTIDMMKDGGYIE